jgi:hypothetical protein
VPLTEAIDATCSPLVSTSTWPARLPRRLAARSPLVSCHQDRGGERPSFSRSRRSALPPSRKPKPDGSTPTRRSRFAVPRRCFVKPVRSAALLLSPRPSLRRGHPSKLSPRSQPYRVTAAACPLDVSDNAAAPTVPAVSLRLRQVVSSPQRCPASPGPFSMNESVAMSARLRRHHPLLPWASIAPANTAAPRVSAPCATPAACRRPPDRDPLACAAAQPRRLGIITCAFAHPHPGPEVGPQGSPPPWPTKVTTTLTRAPTEVGASGTGHVPPEGGTRRSAMPTRVQAPA